MHKFQKRALKLQNMRLNFKEVRLNFKNALKFEKSALNIRKMRLKTLKLVKSAYFSPYGHSKKSALIQKNVRLILINFHLRNFSTHAILQMEIIFC